jgi:hypothetical protein
MVQKKAPVPGAMQIGHNPLSFMGVLVLGATSLKTAA